MSLMLAGFSMHVCMEGIETLNMSWAYMLIAESTRAEASAQNLENEQ